MCPQKQSVITKSMNTLDIRAYDKCQSSFQFPVDSHVAELFLFVDGNAPGANPTISLMDPKGGTSL